MFGFLTVLTDSITYSIDILFIGLFRIDETPQLIFTILLVVGFNIEINFFFEFIKKKLHKYYSLDKYINAISKISLTESQRLLDTIIEKNQYLKIK